MTDHPGMPDTADTPTPDTMRLRAVVAASPIAMLASESMRDLLAARAVAAAAEHVVRSRIP